MKSNLERSALTIYWMLLIFFTIGIPLYIPMSSWDNPGLTDLEVIGLLVGVILNWILLIVFIKKKWNKVILLLLFWPVFRACEMIAKGKPFQSFNAIFFVLGLSMLFQPNFCRQFLEKHSKKKISPSLIRIIGGLTAIAAVLLRF